MPKILTPKELVGLEVIEKNFLIGATVQRNAKKWSYGEQDEEGLGTILSLGEFKKEMSTDYEFCEVMWQNGDTFNYPLDGCLLFSDGTIKTSPFTEFKNKSKLWDIYKIKSHTKGTFTGLTCMVTSKRVKEILMRYLYDGRNPDEFYLTSGNFEEFTFEKMEDTEEKAIAIIEKVAEACQTPLRTKENVLSTLKKHNSDNYNKIFYYTNLDFSDEITKVKIDQICGNANLQGESSITIKTIFGETILQRSGYFTYNIYDSGLRKVVGNEKNTYQNYIDWIKFFEEIKDKVFFSDKLNLTISTSSCNKDLKDYFLKNEKKLNENFIDFDRATKKISFTPKGKPVVINQKGIFAGIRQEVSAHKFFTKYFKEANASEYDIKCFADEVIASFGEYKITEIDDGKIGEFYCNLTQTGWAVGSCMRNKPLEYFALYDKNPHIFKMMAIILDGELVGRCLKVNAKNSKDDSDFTYYDRLYYKNEEVVAWFEAYCLANNAIRKFRNSVDSYRTFFDTKSFNADIYIDITHTLGKPFNKEYPIAPYLDTLGRGCDGYIYNGDKFPVKSNIHYGLPEQFNFRTERGIYTGIGNDFYCFHNECYLSGTPYVVEQGKLKGKTVREQDAYKYKIEALVSK